jgi:Holliday junction resolvasome RuvABC endonuclease subunit
VRVLSLDVSSSAAGWALLHSEPKIQLMDFGLVKPSSRDSLKRIDAIRDRLVIVAEELGPDRIVMEWSAGKLHRSMGRIPGLAVMGQAQGTVREALISRDHHVLTVAENVWSGSVRKEKRAVQIRMLFPTYAAWARKDRGFDVADAAGLGLYWLGRHQIDTLMRGAG